MKKFISILMVSILVLSSAALAGCGSDKESADGSASQSADNNNAQGSAVSDTGEVKGEVADGLEVSALSSFIEDDGKGRVYLFVTNKTGKTVNLNSEYTFLDQDGKIIYKDDDFYHCVGDGTTVCMDPEICEEKFADFEYKVTYEDSEYGSVDQDLTLNVKKRAEYDDCITVSLTNNGSKPAKNVGYRAFFFKDGELVFQDFAYCEDDDNEIKPGATCTDDMFFDFFNDDENKSYDDVKVYFHGYPENY